MIQNQWYLVLDSKELKKRKPLRVRRLNKTLTFWRDEHGMVCCIDDKCCHRGASLGCGKTVNGRLECPFHGFLFDKSGRVTTIPAIGRGETPPENMRVESYLTHEAHGFIWMWYGDKEKVKGQPFFFDELHNYFYATIKDQWNTHYTRAIENNLDVYHLPYVHRTSIGNTNKTLVNGPFYKRENELITFYGYNTRDNGRSRPMDPNQDPDYKNSHKLQFHFPNIWLVYTSRRTSILSAPVPIDDESTAMYVRYYQGWMRIPLIAQFSCWVGKLITRIIANQDKRVVESQLPKKSNLKTDENLIAGDMPIIEYRKHRDYLINN